MSTTPVLKRTRTETDTLRDAMQAMPLHFPGSKIWRANSGGNKSGRKHNSINLVDLVGWGKHGMAIAVEVKTEDGQLRDEQYAFLADVHQRGGYAGLFTPSGLFPFRAMPAKHMTPKQRELHGAVK